MGKKILIIDDNWGILFSTQKALELKQYSVKTADAFDLAAIKNDLPDLIFLDIGLPGKDGGSASLMLKKDRTTMNIPVIIFTAYLDAPRLMKEAKANDYLLKPFNIKELWEKAARYTADTPI